MVRLAGQETRFSLLLPGARNQTQERRGWTAQAEMAGRKHFSVGGRNPNVGAEGERDGIGSLLLLKIQTQLKS